MKTIELIKYAPVLFLGCFIAPNLTRASNLPFENVAFGKPVTLEGAFGTGSGYLGGSIPPLPPASMVTDGIMQSGYWTTGVWWDEQNSGAFAAGISNHVTVDLQGTFSVNRFKVMVDNNDKYLLEYRDTAGFWQTAWQIPEVFCCGGLQYRQTTLPSLVEATALRLTAIYVNTWGHDYAYSVSEIQASSVPLPPAVFLFASGLLGLFGMRKMVLSRPKGR